MLNLPGASIQLFQGMLLFFLLATDLFVNYRVKIGTN
jgi:simple sugar transport system permease protein